jgi:hypothetical protein
MSIPYDSSQRNTTPPQSALPPSDRSQQQPPQQIPYVNNQDALIKYVLSQPNLAEQVARQFGNGVFNGAAPTESPQQMVPQPQMQYQMQLPPYPQLISMQIPQQRQPSLQPIYHQPQTQMYQPSSMQFQPTVSQQPYFQQQVLFQQQRPTLPSVIHYLPNTTNQPSLVAQTQQMPVFQTNGSNNISPQLLEQMNGWNILDEHLNQTNNNSVQQQLTTADQVEKINSLSSFQ